MKKAKELIGSSRFKELHKIIKCIASRFDYMKKFEPKRKKHSRYRIEPQRMTTYITTQQEFCFLAWNGISR
jgi:hypothetical protein